MKFLKILSNGSLFFDFDNTVKIKQIVLFEKDNKNFYLNKKNKTYKIESKNFLNYKNKYLIK